MSEEDVEIVRRAIAAFNERDFSQVPEVFDPEIVIDLSGNIFNPDVYRGYDGVKRYVETIEEMWDRFEFEVEEVIPVGHAVITATRASGVGRGSGIPVDMRVFQVITLRGGRLLHMTGAFRDRAEAFEAAGLEE
jgi:ketosteroid isomerase-like protein